MRPVVDINAEKLEHPGHGKGKVGQIGQSRAVGEGNIVLAGQREPFVENIPLAQAIRVQLLDCAWQLDGLLARGISSEEIQPILGSRPGILLTLITLIGEKKTRLPQGCCLVGCP